jgi:hypothetical protein
MELNPAQLRFTQDLEKMLALYQQNADPRLKSPATNLTWNLKKVTGAFSGESLDGATFAQRTKADLELIAAALPQGAAGQAYAARAAGEVAGVFGGNSVGGAPASGAGSPNSSSAGGSVSAGAASAPEAPELGAATSSAGGGGSWGADVDVPALLAEKAAHAGEKLAWKTSVVDLLKVLGKDSSQSARHRYAVALGFPEAEISNMPSSEFNAWLHGQLLSTLASNGGALPSNIA